MGGSVWGLMIVSGAVKEGESGNVAIYRALYYPVYIIS